MPSLMSELDDKQLTDLVVQRISNYDIRNKGPYPETEFGFNRAAVLLPLSVHEGNVYVWLTKRSKHLRAHPSAVAFPGGKRDDTDSSDIDAALREAEEEIGLPPDKVKIIGILTLGIAFPNTVVYPIVGLIPHDFKPVCNPSEVDFAFVMPLSDFLDEKNISCKTYPIAGGNHYIARHISYAGEDGRKAEVWGFTANYCLLLAKIIFDQTQPFKMLITDMRGADLYSEMERYFNYLSDHYRNNIKPKL